jgi:hypothetical protein
MGLRKWTTQGHRSGQSPLVIKVYAKTACITGDGQKLLAGLRGDGPYNTHTTYPTDFKIKEKNVNLAHG